MCVFVRPVKFGSVCPRISAICSSGTPRPYSKLAAVWRRSYGRTVFWQTGSFQRSLEFCDHAALFERSATSGRKHQTVIPPGCARLPLGSDACLLTVQRPPTPPVCHRPSARSNPSEITALTASLCGTHLLPSAPICASLQAGCCTRCCTKAHFGVMASRF